MQPLNLRVPALLTNLHSPLSVQEPPGVYQRLHLCVLNTFRAISLRRAASNSISGSGLRKCELRGEQRTATANFHSTSRKGSVCLAFVLICNYLDLNIDKSRSTCV